jgi:hypothetical protein
VIRGAWLAAVLIAAGWLAIETSQILFRTKAETLLAATQSLEVNRSTWPDAQKLISQWGKWGGYYGDCNSEHCRYSVAICHLCSLQPSSVLENGPRLGTRILEAVGLHSSGAIATFEVKHGVVAMKKFTLTTALPVSKWTTPESRFWLQASKVGSTYWPSVDVTALEANEIQSTSVQIIRHPNRSFLRRRITLEASFTPNESAEERAALMDFHFDCITRWFPCTSRQELLPRAEAEFNEDVRLSNQ